ncbi:MAG: hypothetical protein LBQ40_07070 [Clostridiales bacterium]|jgi:Ni2+-binding GTPase involved in maturation of urease and hydrogenase|nr:hypothetical protein [Clostridiales bacterium]
MPNKKQKIVIVGGPPAAGKTAVISQLIGLLKDGGVVAAVCKIDCLKTRDDEIYRALGVAAAAGLSKDICPDHFLAVNLEEIALWGERRNADILIIETAGLCHRCAPATKNTIAVCVLDCVQSIRVPDKVGPVLTNCDIAVITKGDMVSQAETEVFWQSVRLLNQNAEIVEVNGATGAGAQYLKIAIDARQSAAGVVGDELRHDMPSAICSYCVGERRIGNIFQQGVVTKMEFSE